LINIKLCGIYKYKPPYYVAWELKFADKTESIMKTRQIFTYGLIAVMLALAFTACDPDTGGGTPTVTSVTVSTAGNAAFVNKGSSLQFNAEVIGTNSPATTVTWSIETAGKKAGTTISTGGLLTVASDEAVATLTIRATSTVDNTKSGIANVTVNDSNLSNLTGDVTITVNGSPVTTANTGTQLTANYTGSEQVSCQWYRDGTAIGGATSKTYTPYESGSYTVIVSLQGYNSKISAVVTVTGTDIPPENKPVADRWSKFVNEESTATLDYSVDSDGVCAITIGGTPMPNNSTDGWNSWRASASYSYTAKANTTYKYIFKAWTDSGTRNIDGPEYYGDDDEGVYLQFFINITDTPTTYTEIGTQIPKGGIKALRFKCANQTAGTFYVEIISITEYTPRLEYELIDNGTAYRVISAKGMGGTVETPATYNNLPVTEIGSMNDDYDKGAFYRTSITAVNIPASVTSIGQCAFWDCTSLTSITIPASVMSIGSAAFWGCTSLTSITIPEGVTSIDRFTFNGCTSLTSIEIPAGVTSIGEFAFNGWTSSQTINVQFASETLANEAWGYGWRSGCDAVIKYWNGSTWE